MKKRYRDHKTMSLVILLLVLMPGLSTGQETRNSGAADDPTAGVFDEIARASRNTTTIQSKFTQVKHLAIMENPVRSQGVFHFKKDNHMRWEITRPNRWGFYLNGSCGERWRGDVSQKERFCAQQSPGMKVFIEQVVSWVNADFETLRKGYHICILGKAPIDLKLVPLAEQVRKHLAHIRIVFAADARHVDTLEIQETGGDMSRVRFTDVVLNDPLPVSLFN
jgi:outer membrane lipoprotein carrier protein